MSIATDAVYDADYGRDCDLDEDDADDNGSDSVLDSDIDSDFGKVNADGYAHVLVEDFGIGGDTANGLDGDVGADEDGDRGYDLGSAADRVDGCDLDTVHDHGVGNGNVFDNVLIY